MNFPIMPVMDEIEKIARLGFDYIELTLDAPCAHWTEINKIRNEIRAALETNDLGIACHLPTFVHTADLSPAIRQASVDEMIHSLDAAAIVGAKKAVLHPSIIFGLAPLVLDTALTYSAESLDTIFRHAGTLDITICFENLYPQCHAFFDPDEFKRVFKAYPGMMMCLDAAHANIDDPAGKRIFDFLEKFTDRIGHIHLSDNQGKFDEHLAIGQGNINFKRFMAKLVRTGFNDTITLEVFSQNPADLIRSRDYIAGMI